MIDAPAGWSSDGNAWVKTFDRKEFDGAVAFVNAGAAAANRLDHHPDIALAWNAVTIRTWSHDVNTTTERDLRLVDAIDDLAARPA